MTVTRPAVTAGFWFRMQCVVGAWSLLFGTDSLYALNDDVDLKLKHSNSNAAFLELSNNLHRGENSLRQMRKRATPQSDSDNSFDTAKGLSPQGLPIHQFVSANDNKKVWRYGAALQSPNLYGPVNGPIQIQQTQQSLWPPIPPGFEPVEPRQGTTYNGFGSSASGSFAAAIVPNCVDVHPKCDYLVTNGKCESPLSFVSQMCPRSCGFCELQSLLPQPQQPSGYRRGANVQLPPSSLPLPPGANSAGYGFGTPSTFASSNYAAALPSPSSGYNVATAAAPGGYASSAAPVAPTPSYNPSPPTAAAYNTPSPAAATGGYNAAPSQAPPPSSGYSAAVPASGGYASQPAAIPASSYGPTLPQYSGSPITVGSISLPSYGSSSIPSQPVALPTSYSSSIPAGPASLPTSYQSSIQTGFASLPAVISSGLPSGAIALPQYPSSGIAAGNIQLPSFTSSNVQTGYAIFQAPSYGASNSPPLSPSQYSPGIAAPRTSGYGSSLWRFGTSVDSSAGRETPQTALSDNFATSVDASSGTKPGVWNKWSEWGACIHKEQYRSRTCNYDSGPGGGGCVGSSYESRLCSAKVEQDEDEEKPESTEAADS